MGRRVPRHGRHADGDQEQDAPCRDRKTRSGTSTDDPRKELVRQLVEYRKTKEAAGHLDRLAEERQFHVPRVPPDDEEGATSPRLRRVEMWDLVSAFGRLVRETESLQPLHLVADETPQSAYLDLVRAKLRPAGASAFRDMFDPPYSRPRLIGVFLAILELIKLMELVLDQDEPSGEIWLAPPIRLAG